MAYIDFVELDLDERAFEDVIGDVAISVSGSYKLTIDLIVPGGGQIGLYLDPHESAQLIARLAQALRYRIVDPNYDQFQAWATEEELVTN